MTRFGRSTTTVLTLLVTALAWAAATPGPSAAATTIKLATITPEGSLWDKELKGMGAEWQKATAGRVALRLYPGMQAGDDAAVVRKMRIGQLQAATLSVVGLAEIDPGFSVFTIPRFFESYDELFYVVEKLSPTFSERLEANGYVLLNWGHGGWVHLFSKQPVQVPDDVKKLKLFTSAGDNKMVQWWKNNGYRPVALAATDIMTGLQTGLIDALPTTPLAALTYQWYRTTPYVLDLGLAPLIGGTVITERAWQKISEADRAAVLKAAKGVEERLEAAVPEQDRKAVAEMESRGLTVTRPESEEQLAAWDEEAKKFATTMQELMVPKDVYELALKARAEFRQRGE